MIARSILTVFTVFTYLLGGPQGCAHIEEEQDKVVVPEFLTDEAAEAYADSVLATLDTEQRIAQLLMVPVYSKTDTARWSEADIWVRDLGLGGIIVMQGGPEHQRIRIRRMQELAEVPLLVASDAEWGLGMRLDSTRSFPRAMTLGATRDADLVREFGEVVGLSLKQTGVNVNFAPVVDVNSNPNNPVIGSRSFGEEVDVVADLGWAYAEGLQNVNVIATAKHFPGHGDSDSDSHKTLPVINQTAERLDSVELEPFRHLFDKGVAAVMVAHLDVPALDSTKGSPSTLSPNIVDTLLRQEMGFKGLAFTDALSMKGFADFVGDRPKARDALIAGNDILLFPGDPVQVIEEVTLAIENGELDSALVADKCKRVLQAKFWVKAGEEVPGAGEIWDPLEAERIHRDIIRSSLTLLTNKGFNFNINAPGFKITILNVANKKSSGAPFVKQFKQVGGRSYTVENFTIGNGAEGLSKSSVQEAIKESDYIIVNFLETSNRPFKNYGVSKNAIDRLVEEMDKHNNEWNYNLFGNPYRLDKDFKDIHLRATALLVAYQDDFRTQEEVANAILSGTEVNGKLPVSIEEEYLYAGDGLSKRNYGRLIWGHDGIYNSWAATDSIDSLAYKAINDGATPGCRIVVAHKGEVVHDKSYGTTNGVDLVTDSTIYDLASITKIASTSLCLMHMNESGYFDLDDPLKMYMPELDTLELGERTFKEVLAHQSGLYPWIPFYRETLNDSIDHMPIDTMYQRIYDCKLAPSGKYRYSDLGYYLIHNMLNNWFESESAIDSISNDWFYSKLGLESMGFYPTRKFDIGQTAPTEHDKIFRECVVQGSVHDPGAHMMGGSCCHAGLFSDAHDLARLGQFLLNGGHLHGWKLIKPETVDAWTARAYPDTENRRGVGFDKTGLNPDEGPASELGSESSFGHSGFTGTLLWVDPEHELVYVFLSNRTFPDAENSLLIKNNVRTEIHRVIMEHILAEKS